MVQDFLVVKYTEKERNLGHNGLQIVGSYNNLPLQLSRPVMISHTSPSTGACLATRYLYNFSYPPFWPVARNANAIYSLDCEKGK